MELSSKTQLKVNKGGKDVLVFIDHDMPLGCLFDAFMELKGMCVDKMVAARIEEEEEAERQMGAEAPEEEEKPAEE